MKPTITVFNKIYLRQLLKDNKISQRQAGIEMGITVQIVNMLCTGATTNPQMSTLLTIMRYFGIDDIEEMVIE